MTYFGEEEETRFLGFVGQSVLFGYIFRIITFNNLFTIVSSINNSRHGYFWSRLNRNICNSYIFIHLVIHHDFGKKNYGC